MTSSMIIEIFASQNRKLRVYISKRYKHSTKQHKLNIRENNIINLWFQYGKMLIFFDLS